MTYQEKLEEIQTVFTNNIQNLIQTHARHIISKYGGWKRYPRKVKKRLKKTCAWNIKDMSLESVSSLKVRMNNKFGVICKREVV